MMTALCEVPRRTPCRVRPAIRFARSDEGALIQALCVANREQMTDWLDWTKPLGHNWLIAELDRPVGCIMVNYGAPIGRLSFLMVPPGLSRSIHARVVRDLCYAGLDALAKHGSQVAAGITSDTDARWARAVFKRGAIRLTTGTLYLKRC